VSPGDLMFVPWFMTINQLGSKFKWGGELRYSHPQAALQSQNPVFFCNNRNRLIKNSVTTMKVRDQ